MTEQGMLQKRNNDLQQEVGALLWLVQWKLSRGRHYLIVHGRCVYLYVSLKYVGLLLLYVVTQRGGFWVGV